MTTLQRSSLLVAILALGAAAVLLLQMPVPAGHPNRQGEIEVVLGPTGVEPDHLYLPTETPLTLRFVNTTDIIHEFAFVRRAAGAEPSEFVDMLDGVATTVDPSTAQIGVTAEHPYKGFRVQIGETVSVQFTVPAARAGERDVGCVTAGGCYYEIGFHVPITVR